MDIGGDKSDLIGVVQTIEELNDSKNQVACENKELKEVLRDLEIVIDLIENSNRRDTVLIDDQEITIRNITRENNNLKTEILNKETELKALREDSIELEQLKQKNENLIQDARNFEMQASKLKDTVTKFEESASEKEHTIQQQDYQLRRLQIKISEYRRTYEVLSVESDCLKKRNEECNTKLEEYNAENHAFIETIDECETSRQTVEECNIELLDRIKRLKRKRFKEITTGEKLSKAITCLENDNLKGKHEIGELKEEIACLNEELDVQQIAIDRCREELKQKIHEFENYKNTLILSLKIRFNFPKGRQNQPSRSQPPSLKYSSESCDRQSYQIPYEKSKSVCDFKNKSWDWLLA